MLAADGTRAVRRAWGALVIAPLLLFFPILLGRVPDMRDLPRFVWPARALWRAAILDGRLPQWNPFVGLGAATLAAPVHGTFYPPNLLLLVGPPLLTLCLMWIAHTVLAGLGGYALARRFGCRPSVAAASGLVWQVGGFATSSWGAGEKVLTWAWVPWAALGLMTLAEREAGRRALAATAVAFALIALAGDPFIWLHAAALGLTLGWAKNAEHEGAHGVLRRLVPRALAMSLLAASLSAVALVPALALLGVSERAGGLGLEAAARWSFLPARTIELLLPGSHGAHADMLIASPYLGLGAVLCAPFAGRRRATWALLVLSALGLLAAFGKYTPLHAILRTVFPPMSYLRYPEKHLVVVTACLSLLGAMGAERVLVSPDLRRLRYPLLAAVALLATALVGGVTASDSAVVTGRAVLIAAALAGVLVLARRRPSAAWLIVPLVLLDLVSAASSYVGWADAALLREPPPELAPRPGARGGAPTEAQPPPRLYYTPSLDGALATLPDNVGVPWGIAHLPGFDPGRPGRQRLLWDAMVNLGQRAADLFDIEWMVLPNGPAVPGLEAVAALGAEATLLRRRSAGRTRIVGRARVLDDQAALAVLGSPKLSVAEQALLAPGDGAVALAGTARGSCKHELYEPEHVRMRCTVEGGPALLVQSEAWSPGWRATMDGQPAPIMRAQVAMRGMYIGPGEHVIDQRFHTPGLWPGILLSVLGLTATLALLCPFPKVRPARKASAMGLPRS